MTTHERMKTIAGRWSATSRLWLMPGDPARESRSTAFVDLVGGGDFALVRYTWEEGGPQDGVMLVHLKTTPSPAAIVWTDSWHMKNAVMVLRGEENVEGNISGLGSYAAPTGPDWGWRIVLAVSASDEFVVRMYNIEPEGEAALAVEAVYARESGH